MYVANTHLKPVIGIDIHFVNLPFPFIPLPHPYIGLVIDPFDYIPFIGATVKVNNVPRGHTDTMGMIITFVHIPFGAGFTLFPMIGHDSQNFFGDKKVNVEGIPMSGAGYMLMTCNDIGIPLGLGFEKLKKKIIPIPSLYLPTSFCIPLQWGKPVMVGGPLTPNFNLLGILHAAAFGAALKGLGKMASKLLKKLNKALPNKGFSNKLGTALCKMGFEPVDLISGRVNYEYTDFELPGAISIKWTRNWDSDARFQSMLGHGTHVCYDRYVKWWPEDSMLTVVLADGRLAAFPLLHHGESFYHPQEKILLRRKQNGHFLLEDYNESLYYHFNYNTTPDVWRLSLIENYSGSRIQLHYSGNFLRGITDSAGRKLLFDLDKQGRITKVEVRHRDKQQVLVTYAYNEAGDMVSIGDALDQQTTVEYRDHLMVKKTDRNGQSFYWEYDKHGRCVHTWGDGGLLEGHIEYHNGYNNVTNSVGETTTYYFNENNLCIQQTDHYGNHRYTEYTEDFHLYRETDEEGNITGYTYDEKNGLAAKMLPDGSTTQYKYNERNQIVTVQYPDKGMEVYVYDDQYRTRFINYPGGAVTTFEYNIEGQLEALFDSNQGKTLMTYDEDENLAEVQLDNGAVARWKYDALGRCIQSVNEAGQVRSFEYDQLNRVRQLHLPDGNTVRYQYDAYEVISVTDRHNQVQYEYTGLGKVSKRRQNNTEMRFLYDTEERLHTIINEKGQHYRFDYNKRGEVTGETGFDGLTLRFERDATGKVIRQVRAGNRSTSFEYDANGRVVRTTFYDGTYALLNYDRNDNIIEATNEHGSVRFTYDKMEQVTREEQGTYIVTSSYNTAGDRTGLSSNLGADLQFDANNLGLITNMKVRLKDKTWQAAMTYNAAGQEIERHLPGDILSEWQYDQAGKAIGHKVSRRGTAQSWKKYTWTTNDRLVNIFDVLTQASTRFRHDALNNLVFAQYADNQIVHRSADNAGNIFDTADQTGRTYNAAGALLDSKKFSYKYDEEGNLISKIEKATNRKTQYEWYASGMLKKVLRPDGKTVDFTYDALGRRISKRFDGKITRWVWDQHVPLHEWTYNEHDEPRAIVNEWGDIEYDRQEPSSLNTTEVMNAITWIFEEESMAPVAKIENDKSYSIVCDHLGTPTLMFDEHGKKVWEGVLDIYGNIRTLQGVKSSLPFRYQGQYEDVETGLYYNRFRYYSPGEGLYISQDPIRMDGSNLTFYAYVSDTNSWVDLFGLTGTYMFQFETGETYIGKGPRSRFLKSIRKRRRQVKAAHGMTDDPKVIRQAHIDFGDDKMGFMVEHHIMRSFQYGSNGMLLNDKTSPGLTKFNDPNTKDVDRWLVRQRAKKLIKQFKKSRCK